MTRKIKKFKLVNYLKQSYSFTSIKNRLNLPKAATFIDFLTIYGRSQPFSFIVSPCI